MYSCEGRWGTKITIYRKPTHTDQYLNFSSNHPLEHKSSVVRTLTHRAKEFVTTSKDQECELKHVHNALLTNGCTEWALVIPKEKAKTKPTSANTGKNIQTTRYQCVQQTREHSIRSILVHPKDKTLTDMKFGVIYEITCYQDPARTRVHR